MRLKRLKIFDIAKVCVTRDGIFVVDAADQTYYIARDVEGNVPHDGVHADGRIWMIMDMQAKVLRWKFMQPIWEGWD